MGKTLLEDALCLIRHSFLRTLLGHVLSKKGVFVAVVWRLGQS
jgi:hypothetical protein